MTGVQTCALPICTVLRPEGVREFIEGREEIFPAERLDELVEVFQAQGAKPSGYALPDYEAVMDVLEGGIYKELRRLLRVADGLPQRTYKGGGAGAPGEKKA